MNDTNRREFLKTSVKGAAVLGVGMSALSLLPTAQAAADKADVSMPGDKKPVTNEELFRMGVVGPAELSLLSSNLALEKATDKDVKEFAGFEQTEAIAVTSVLKQLGTAVPAPDAKAKATMEKLQSAAKGAEFDKAYIMVGWLIRETIRKTVATNASSYRNQRFIDARRGAFDAQQILGEPATLGRSAQLAFSALFKVR